MVKVTRKCDGCGLSPLRKAEAYTHLNDERFENLCPKCFDLWLDGKLEEKK